MTIDEFVKENDLPEVKVFGQMKNFTYYIDNTLKPDEKVGIPTIIEYNKITREFTVVDSNQALDLMGYFK